MPRPIGSVNKKGKQSLEERKARRKASKKTNSAESRQKEYAQRKVDRREKKIQELNDRIRKQRQALHSVGRFTGAEDPALKELGILLDRSLEEKLDYVSAHGPLTLDPGTDISHLNRVVMMVFHCKIQHEAKGCKKKTLPKFIQSELQRGALEAETVTKDTLRNFFRRLFREEVFSAKNLAQAQDQSLCSQISGGSIDSLRSMEGLSPREKGVFPSRSSVQLHNYHVESGTESKYLQCEETEDGSIFRISVSCILNEMLSTSNDLIQHFGRNVDEIHDPTKKPPVIRLAATIDGGALTCHKGFIIYGIKFVQREMVNLILGKDIFDGSVDDVEGVQSVRLIQMLGFCQGDDNLEHNKRLANVFFKELQQIEKDGYYYVPTVDKYFIFEIIYVMDKNAQWLVCESGGASYCVRFFCNHCSCRPETRHFPSYQRCPQCVANHPPEEGKTCRHSEEWTEKMIDTIVDWEISHPQRTFWFLRFPNSSDNAQTWKSFVTSVLGLPIADARTDSIAKQSVKNWCAEYDLFESDSSMLEERLYTWLVVIENLRVRRVDTAVFADVGKTVPNGTPYDLVYDEAILVDRSLDPYARYSLEASRLVLKYVMVMGNKMAYAKHIASKTERMCSKIENVMECGLHLDNRIGHNQFQHAVDRTCEHGTVTEKEDRIKRISNILCRALSHIPLDGSDEMITASYSLKFDSKKNRLEALKLSNVRLQQIMNNEWYRPMMEVVYEAFEDKEQRIYEEMEINRLYLQMMQAMRQTQDFSPQQLQQLQDKIDEYCDMYLKRHGNRDVTNYLHTLQAGHVRQQIARFGNLFRFANVGFEAYIGTIRRYLTRRTQNGGHGGKGINKVGNAHQACRLAKRVSVKMIAAMAQKDHPTYYDDLVALGKRSRGAEIAQAAVPVVDD